MTDEKVPASIRVEVPEEFGSAYTNADGNRQWVERRQRMGKSLIKKFEKLDKFYTDDKAFKEGCKVLATVFTDWDLCDDHGPLPKPWDNPDAFDALLECDLDLSLWALGLIHMTVAELIQPEKN